MDNTLEQMVSSTGIIHKLEQGRREIDRNYYPIVDEALTHVGDDINAYPNMTSEQLRRRAELAYQDILTNTVGIARDRAGEILEGSSENLLLNLAISYSSHDDAKILNRMTQLISQENGDDLKPILQSLYGEGNRNYTDFLLTCTEEQAIESARFYHKKRKAEFAKNFLEDETDNNGRVVNDRSGNPNKVISREKTSDSIFNSINGMDTADKNKAYMILANEYASEHRAA